MLTGLINWCLLPLYWNKSYILWNIQQIDFKFSWHIHVDTWSFRWQYFIENKWLLRKKWSFQFCDSIFVSELATQPRVPQIEADDAAIANIELRDQVKRLEIEVKEKQDKVKKLTDDLQRLSRDTSKTFQNNSTSPMSPSKFSI